MPEFPYVVPDHLIEAFDANGFVVTPDVLTAPEVDQYSAAVDAEVARRTANDKRPVSDKTIYEQSFIQCMRLWETAPEVLPLSCHAGLAGVAAQLLQVSGVRMWQDQALYKEAGGRETTPHQDQTFWPLGQEPLVSAWIPFDKVTRQNGAMAYVPGSHKAGRLKVVDITHTSDPYDILSDPALNGAQPQYVAVEPGSVIWHHGMTVHQAGANDSTATRRVFTVVYISDQARRAAAWPAYPLDRDNIAVGEVIAGPGMPQVWPPLDAWPEPPTAVSVAVGPQYQRD